MTKKPLIGIVIALVAIVGVGLVIALQMPRNGVTKANVDQLRLGMTRAEVDSVLGPKHQLGGRHLLTDPAKEVSCGSEGEVWLVFNDDDTLIGVNWFDRVESVGEKLCRLLPWLPF